MIKRGTHFVLDDELAIALFEMNFKAQDQMSRRRYEIILVVRDGEEAEYRRDLGLASQFTEDQIRIPSFMEHTVGELRDMANFMRSHLFDKKELARQN